MKRFVIIFIIATTYFACNPSEKESNNSEQKSDCKFNAVVLNFTYSESPNINRTGRILCLNCNKIKFVFNADSTHKQRSVAMFENQTISNDGTDSIDNRICHEFGRLKHIKSTKSGKFLLKSIGNENYLGHDSEKFEITAKEWNYKATSLFLENIPLKYEVELGKFWENFIVTNIKTDTTINENSFGTFSRQD